MKILILLSGGVDSTYCLLRNKKLGYKNIYCLYIKIWHNNCKYKNSIRTIFTLKNTIGFKIIILNLEKKYYINVFIPFIKLYKKGFTPNCDVLCNEKIKFRYLKYIVKKKKINRIFSGHYIRIDKNNIYCSIDKNKDQSFFLCKTKFINIYFPLGFLLKRDVKFLINFINIKVDKSSKGICFIEKKISEVIDNKINATVMYNNRKIGFCSFYKTVGQKVFLKNNIYYIYNKIRQFKILNVCKHLKSSFLITKLFIINDIFFRYRINFSKIRVFYVKIRNTSLFKKSFVYYYKYKMYINLIDPQVNVSVGQTISIYNNIGMLILCGKINCTFNKGFSNF